MRWRSEPPCCQKSLTQEHDQAAESRVARTDDRSRQLGATAVTSTLQSYTSNPQATHLGPSRFDTSLVSKSLKNLKMQAMLIAEHIIIQRHKPGERASPGRGLDLGFRELRLMLYISMTPSFIGHGGAGPLRF